MKHIIIGYLGEVGKAIYRILKEGGYKVYGLDRNHKTEYIPIVNNKNNIEYMMHICIPYSKKFEEIIYNYNKEFTPKIVVIHSTVEPGTTELCWEDGIRAVYSPVRGKHPNIYEDIKKYTKWIAGPWEPEVNKVAEAFEKCGLKTRVLDNPTTLESAKLYETTYIGWKIIFFQMMKREDEDFDYDIVCDFMKETSPIYRRAGIIDNEGSGKHCIMNNVEILKENYSDIAKIIKESNEKRKLELSD